MPFQFNLHFMLQYNDTLTGSALLCDQQLPARDICSFVSGLLCIIYNVLLILEPLAMLTLLILITSKFT